MNLFLQDSAKTGELLEYHDKLDLTPAMHTALFHKPHDRQFVVELEDAIVSFIESNAESYELRPMNSYYRLLSHQIAEYHNLKHALARTHDNCVIIFKGEAFERRSERPLLQQLQPMLMASPTLEPLVPMIPSQEIKNGKKYKILKRREEQDGATTSLTMDDKDSTIELQSYPNDSETTLEQQRIEREKQYEQRKQEIFDSNKKDGQDIPPEKDGEGNSPQPYQFETSRYRFNQVDSQPPPQAPRFNNRRKKISHYNENNNNNNDRKKAYHSDSMVGHNNVGMPATPYNLPYMMYPAPLIPPNSSNPAQYPLMYPTPFPMEGNNGYVPQFMYQPIPAGNVTPKTGVPTPYMSYPFPYQYDQTPNYSPVPQYRQHHQPYTQNNVYHRNQRNYNQNSAYSKTTRTGSNSGPSSSRSSISYKRSTSSMVQKNEISDGKKTQSTSAGDSNSEEQEINSANKGAVGIDIEEAAEGIRDLSV